MFEHVSEILRNLSDSETYNLAPPIGPPIEYPTLTFEELEVIQQVVFGKVLGDDYAYESLKLLEEPRMFTIDPLTKEELDGQKIWGIDGSNYTLNFSAFQYFLTRASIVEYQYSIDSLPKYHNISKNDCLGICIVDQNVFDDSVFLFGHSTSNLPKDCEISWIDVVDESKSPLIVSFDPYSKLNPSAHTFGWSLKIMATLELMALNNIPIGSHGVVIRDGPLYPICATIGDTQRTLLESIQLENKICISSSKRIDESTLFVELLTNPNNSHLLEYYFPDQRITQNHVNKLPADYLLLPKILQPGQRKPFIEAIPRSRKAICEANPELTPVCCYYMRKREPHTIIRIEFPRHYLRDQKSLMRAVKIVAWQHEIGTKVPEIQEAADKHCQLKPESDLLRKITFSQLAIRGLETLEAYE